MGFSEMQDHVIMKKGWIKQELFHLGLVPKFPTSLMNKSEATQGNISPSIVSYLISEFAIHDLRLAKCLQ